MYYWSPFTSPKHNNCPYFYKPVSTLWKPEGGEGFNIDGLKSDTV